MYSSDIRYSQLQNIQDTFEIANHYYLVASNRDNRDRMLNKEDIAVYCEKLRAGLRFLLYPSFRDMLTCWEISLAQLSPNFVRKTIGFILICKEFGLPTGLEVFQNLFDVKALRDGPGWYSLHQTSSLENFIIKFLYAIH